MDVMETQQNLFHDLLDIVHLNDVTLLLLAHDVLVEVDRNEFEYHIYFLNTLVFELYQIHNVLVFETFESGDLAQSGRRESKCVVILDNLEILDCIDLIENMTT